MSTTLQVLLDAEDVTDRVAEGSLQIFDNINRRSTCGLILNDQDATMTILEGYPIIVKDAGTTIFAGYLVPTIETSLISPRTGAIKHSITAADYHQILDRLTMSKSYVNQDASAIVGDIITTYLAAEGITAGTLTSGCTVSEAVFNHVYISDALDELAARADYVWYIDWDKTLSFIPRAANTAPWTITESDCKLGATVSSGNQRYRNKVIIPNAKDLTTLQTEPRKGDGTTRVFQMSWPLAKAPTIQVKIGAGSYVTKTVGIKGIDTGRDWYWNKDEKEVVQDNSGTVLTANDTLSVAYYGTADFVITAWDAAQMQVRADREGSGTGAVENVKNADRMDEGDSYTELANSDLLKYCRDARKVNIMTTRTGLEAGQLATFNLPKLKVTEELLIESIRISQVTVTENGLPVQMLKYSVTAVRGPIGESWTSFFKALSDKARVFTISMNAGSQNMSIVLRNYSETINVADAATITVYQCPVVRADGDSSQWVVRADGDPLQMKVC